MREGLLNDINRYISYLKAQGLFVSVHGKMISGLVENNVHNNPYCAFIKTNDEAWKRCVRCQQKVFRAYNRDYIFGMCYAGVEEYVFYVDSKTFISVSGYGIHQKKAADRMRSLSQNYAFNLNELMPIYEQGLNHTPENIDELKTKIKPLCHMLSLLQLLIGNLSESDSKNKTFDAILAFVQRNFMQDISLREIADACACSESTVSHLFKEHTGTSIKKHILTLRITQAEKLLRTSDLPVTEIALLCGFSNANYFSTAFRKQTGFSPSSYRTSPSIAKKKQR